MAGGPECIAEKICVQRFEVSDRSSQSQMGFIGEQKARLPRVSVVLGLFRLFLACFIFQ